MSTLCESQVNLTLNTDVCYETLGFSTAPFNITPDTDFLVPQRQYLETIGSLRFGLASGNFTLLTGDVGLGKTLLCRYLMQNLSAMVKTAYVFNPQQSYSEFLAAILFDLTGASTKKDASSASLHTRLFNILSTYASHDIQVALVIDEAHLLKPDLLEGLRLLSNLETDKRKLLSLLLVGQNELEKTLQLPDLRALRQRISVWCRLRAFTLNESIDYIRHRLCAANVSANFEITTPACSIAHHYARGVPRRLNQICDRALLGAFSSYQSKVGARLMLSAAREVVALERDQRD